MRLLTAAVVCAAGGLLGIAPPAPAGEKEKLPAPTRAQVLTSQNNLKQIMLAFHNYEAVNNHFPNNVYTKDGKGLLSWRVLILPYLEQDALYKAFKLDEAWDSDANKKLAEKMPKVYAPIRVKAEPGETFYRGFAGKGALFGPDKGGGLKVTGISDGTSNTGAVFEAADPVVWTKPDDLPFEEKKELPKLGGLFDGVFHVALCDGSVMRCRKDPDADQLRYLIGYQEAMVNDLDKLRAK